MKKIAPFSIFLFILVYAVGTVFASGVPGTGWWSAETVQNVGSSQVSVQVVAYDASSSSTYSASKLIDPGKNYTFLPSGADFTPSLPSGFQGSAVVSADGPIKAITNVQNVLSGSLGVTGGKASGIYQGIDGSAVATTVYFR